METKIKSKTIVKELSMYVQYTGKYDRVDQIEWLMKKYPDVFKTAMAADEWLNDLHRAR